MTFYLFCLRVFWLPESEKQYIFQQFWKILSRNPFKHFFLSSLISLSRTPAGLLLHLPNALYLLISLLHIPISLFLCSASCVIYVDLPSSLLSLSLVGSICYFIHCVFNFRYVFVSWLSIWVLSKSAYSFPTIFCSLLILSSFKVFFSLKILLKFSI